MSRALDQDAAAAIMASSPQSAYSDIVEALNSSTSELLDIEFLGKSHPLPPGCNVLIAGSSIGIPKTKLIQAFVVARQLFFKCLVDFKDDNFSIIRDTTAVMLLMDPEHITAANARKRIINRLRLTSEVDFQKVLRMELLVIDSYLTSRLHRHTKSPTLWGHRRWLLENFRSLNVSYDVQRDAEVIVLVAAERHPRNYYAWLHLRWLVQRFRSTCEASLSYTHDQSKLITLLKEWCLRHPGDTSGWSFLLFYLCSIEPKDTATATRSSIFEEVLNLAKSFQWVHESVWVFLRTLVAARDIEEDQRGSLFPAMEAVLAQSSVPEAQHLLKHSRNWRVEYSM